MGEVGEVGGEEWEGGEAIEREPVLVLLGTMGFSVLFCFFLVGGKIMVR